MGAKRYIMNAGRTTKQGQQINVGKDSEAYQAIVNTITMHPDDLKDAGITPGSSVKVKSSNVENDVFLPDDHDGGNKGETKVPAWEEVRAGRYRPRRIKGSCVGRELG